MKLGKCFLLPILMMILATLPAMAGEGNVVVVYPPLQIDGLEKQDLPETAGILFRAGDILAEYPDGSALVLDTDDARKVIEENNLPVDPSLTSPDRYASPLSNEQKVEAFLKKSKMISKFEASKPSGSGFFVVQFQGPILEEWIRDLESGGNVIIDPLPPYGYLVWGQGLETLPRTKAQVRSVSSVNAVRKLSPAILDQLMSAEGEGLDEALTRNQGVRVLMVDALSKQADTARDALLKIEGVKEKKYYRAISSDYMVWEIETTLENIPLLANNSEVFYIEPVGKATLCGERENILNTGRFDATGEGPLPGASYERWLADKRVNGAGVTVQCTDTGLDRGNATNYPGTAHTDILGRIAGVADYSGDDNGVDKHGHGTLNAGIISGNPFTRLKDPDNYLVSMGVSPKTKIFATKVSDSTKFFFRETHKVMVQEARSYGASISLQPWGVKSWTFNPLTGEFSDPPVYSQSCKDFDDLTRIALRASATEVLPMLFVFSAGNDGWHRDMFGAEMVKKSIAIPAMAKNIISVGAFTGSPPEGGNRRDPVYNTSRGYTQDGRIAPTLVAPGIGITGMASQSEEYQNKSPVLYPEGQTLYTRGNGSSHAAAQVAGAGALFTDWWQRFNNYATTPSPAMIKAALVNSTEDEEGGTYPVYIPDSLLGEGQPVYEEVDFAPEINQGWGGLNLDKLIPDPGSENEYIFFDQNTATLKTGETWEKKIYAIDNSTPLYITLCWTDPSASPSTGKALVNDLDLTLVNGAAQTIHGNAFRKGWSTVEAVYDRANNVEVIKIPNPYGQYTLKVKAQSINGEIYPGEGYEQDFAIAIRGATLASPKGMIAFTAPYYMCDSTAGVILADLDLLGQGSQLIRVTNQNNSQFVDVTVLETPANSGVYEGSFDLVSAPEAGKLLAVDGDVLYTEYNDADDGTGSSALVSSTAELDCTPPQVTNFVVSKHTAFSLELAFSFNKKVTGVLKYGTEADPGKMTNVIPLEEASLHHTLEMGGLNPCTVFYSILEIQDAVGNTATDDNSGSYYSFQTLEDTPSFEDDFDEKYVSSNFSTGAFQGTDDWDRIDDSGNAHSPTHYMHSAAVNSIKDIYLKSKNVYIQPHSRLTFYHKFNLEPGFDGAVAEISTDNGQHWTDLGQHIVEGNYNAMIALFSGNPLMARLAWTYAWGSGKVEYRRSWIDLGTFAGKVAQIRFRLATDDSIALSGQAWYVDDVKISYDSDCEDALFIRFMDRSNFGPDETATIRVYEPTLASEASVTVTVKSDTEPAGETVTLTNTAANIYEGTITVKNEGPAAGDGKISCTDGEVLTAMYSSSANGGTANPDKVSASAFYFLPSLIMSPPLNEGVSKLNNDVQNALVFPMEFTALGADVIIKSITFAPTLESQLDPPTHVPTDGVKIYEDTNEDRAFTSTGDPNSDDLLLGTASMNPDGTVNFTALDYTVGRDNSPRLFLMMDLTNQVPFGTRFQIEIPDLATDLVAQLQDSTPITCESERDPKGLDLKIISRALLVNQSAPTIYLEDGETWETAYRTIGDAMLEANKRSDRSKLPVEIWVARGRYLEYLNNHSGKPIKSNVQMYGGFGGDEMNKVDPRRYIMETIIEPPQRGYDEDFHQDVNYLVDIYGGGVIDGFHILQDFNYNNVKYNDMYPWVSGIYGRPSGGKGIKIRNCILRNFRDYAIAAYGGNDCPNSIVSNCIFAYLRRAPVEDLGSGSMFINCSFYNTGGWDVSNRNYYFYNCAWDYVYPMESKMYYGPQLYGGVDEFNRVRNCFFPHGAGRDDIYGDDRKNQKAKPMWVNPDYFDMRLEPGSPCIDAGRSQDNTKPELAQEFPALDILGNNRIIGSEPDAGAIEYDPTKPMIFIKDFEWGDPEDPKPIVFRPDQPVSLRLTLGTYNLPLTMTTLGGRLSINDRHFQSDRTISLFGISGEEGATDMNQLEKLPYTLTLKGNPPAFYTLKMFFDYLKTDGTNEVLDTTFFTYQLPVFIDPVSGNDDNNGGIREPLKTITKAFYYLFSPNFFQDPKFFICEGTIKDYIYKDRWWWQYWPSMRLEILGGFNPRTWERAPRVFETVWTGENQRRFLYLDETMAVKLDGFTFKDGVDQSIEIIQDGGGSSGYWCQGTNDITNNIFRNNNGIAIIRFYSYAGRRWYSEPTYPGWLQKRPLRSAIGAPLTNAGDVNGSCLMTGEASWNVGITNDEDLKLSEFTIECWIRPRNLQHQRYYFNTRGEICRIHTGDNDYIYIYHDTDNRLYAQYKNTGWSDYYGQRLWAPANRIEPGKWQHVALVMKKDSQNDKRHYTYMYINGRLETYSERTWESSFEITPTAVTFGPLDGAMDEIRVWNRALGIDEILANRDKEIMTGNGLQLALHFNETSGNSTVSSVGNFESQCFYIFPEVDGNPTFNVSNNLFEDNKAVGIQLWDGCLDTLIHNNIFQNNQNRFVRVKNDSPMVQISNNVVINNSPPDQIPLIYCDLYEHNVWIMNNTIVGNDARVFNAERNDYDGDRFLLNAVVNNIIFDNTQETVVDAGDVPAIPGRFVYNLIKEGDVGDPVVDPGDWVKNFTCVDPEFDADGYHLLSTSCARGKGPGVSLASPMPSLGLVKDPIRYFDEQDDSILTIETDGDTGQVDYADRSYASDGSLYFLRRGGATCTYNLSTLPEGKWELFMWIGNTGWYNADVPYQITHQGKTTTVNLIPDQYRGQWMSFGTFECDSSGMSLKIQWEDKEKWIYIPIDKVRAIYRPELPDVGTTDPPSGYIAQNFWGLDKDIDGQDRPKGTAWDVGADQYYGPGNAVVKARLESGSAHLAGIPFGVDLKLQLNYENAPAGFRFRVQYPDGAVTDLTAEAGDLAAAPTVGSETSAGSGFSYREVSAIPGNTANTERNPQLVKLNITVADPYPGDLTIEILPPDSADAVVDGSGAGIPVTIDDAILANLEILAPNPQANFSAVPTRGLINPEAGLFLNVYFQDASQGYVTSWDWDFGDGGTSTDQNPMHEYIMKGNYDITLTVEGPYGKSTMVRKAYIAVRDPRSFPELEFTAEPYNNTTARVEGPAPLRVEFLEAVTGPVSDYLWDFGDGESSTAQNPTHIYQNQGDYTVKFTVSGPMNPSGDTITKTNFVHVTAPAEPTADFLVDNPYGFAPLSCGFQNQSTGTNIQFYYYDFGDGNWSQSEDANHDYVMPGKYNATLTIAGASGFDVSDPKEIEVKEAFPEKIIAAVLTGEATITQKEKDALDYNKDGKLDVADIIFLLGSE